MHSSILNQMLQGMTHPESNLMSAILNEVNQWQNENKVQRLWAGDPSLWTNHDENRWMGWLHLCKEKCNITRIEQLAKELQKENITDIVLLGMGGSSLCPSMFADTFGKINPYPRLRILDSTDPAEIHSLQTRIDFDHTVFLVSSKSGTTFETQILTDYFYQQCQTILKRREVGDHFIAITDPETSLEKTAKNQHFKAIFQGRPSVGGRYSALSHFGMVPLGLMGIPVDAFLKNVEPMVHTCSPTTPVINNPGVVLGIILGIAAKQGKDKLTLITSPGIQSLGAWIEQLIAESTGKEGQGLIPIDQEPLGNPSVYGHDRLFVYIRLESEPNAEQDHAVHALEKAGYIVIKLPLEDTMHLGAELFRWEIATAVAGSVIGINPFNQPDVEETKALTLHFTEQYQKIGEIKKPDSFFSEGQISLFTNEDHLNTINHYLTGERTLKNYLHAFLKCARQNDYVNFSAFIAMLDSHITSLQKSRILIRDATQLATCFGFGPRFLHSTGQIYKGGPNTGLFFQITANHRDDIPIPHQPYTFGLALDAQAQADFNVLVQRNRRVLRVHLGDHIDEGLRIFVKALQDVLK